MLIYRRIWRKRKLWLLRDFHWTHISSENFLSVSLQRNQGRNIVVTWHGPEQAPEVRVLAGWLVMASTSTWTMAFRHCRLGFAVCFLESYRCWVSVYFDNSARGCYRTIDSALTKSVIKVICFLSRIKWNSHMLISVNIELPRSLYLKMQCGSQWQCIHVGHMYD